jgi:hypothetical protein
LINRFPQQTAWVILLISFACFGLLCVGMAGLLYWFVYQSPMSLTATVTVSRGSLILQTAGGDQVGVYSKHTVDPHTLVTINDDSQGILTIQDTYSNETVATITLLAGSHVVVTNADRPRFDISRRPFTITLDSAEGSLLVTATPRSRAFMMNINTDAGTAQLTDDGTYTIATRRDHGTLLEHLQVFNQGGEAWIRLLSNRTQKVWPNTIGNAIAGSDEIQMTNSPLTILASGLFADQPPSADIADRAQSLPDGWQCTSLAEGDQPQGQFARDPSQGWALHLWRTGANLGHGETSCLITPNPPDGWLDTTGYSTLRIHMRLKLRTDEKNHIPDVPLCGVAASECPITIELIWSAGPDSQPTQTWHHGFYTITDPSLPLTCDTCRIAHDHINSDVWYVYDSGDLHQQLSNGPIYIQKLSVYSSGHQYEAWVGEITLLGGN